MIDTVLYYTLAVSVGFIAGLIVWSWAGMRDAAKEFYVTMKKHADKEEEIIQRIQGAEERFTNIEQETKAKKEAIIEHAQHEANKIVEEAKEIKQQARQQSEEARQEWQRAYQTLEEAEEIVETINKYREIVRKKKWKHLQNLALSQVPKARVKEEINKANRTLIYLDDLYRNTIGQINMTSIDLPTIPIDDSEEPKD